MGLVKVNLDIHVKTDDPGGKSYILDGELAGNVTSQGASASDMQDLASKSGSASLFEASAATKLSLLWDLKDTEPSTDSDTERTQAWRDRLRDRFKDLKDLGH